MAKILATAILSVITIGATSLIMLSMTGAVDFTRSKSARAVSLVIVILMLAAAGLGIVKTWSSDRGLEGLLVVAEAMEPTPDKSPAKEPETEIVRCSHCFDCNYNSRIVVPNGTPCPNCGAPLFERDYEILSAAN